MEEGNRSYAFLALYTHVPIPSGIAAAGFKFGLALLGTWMGCENSWSASWGVLCSCKHVQTGDPNASGKSQWKRFAGVKEFVQTAGVNGFQPNTTFASEHKCMLWDGLDLD